MGKPTQYAAGTRGGKLPQWARGNAIDGSDIPPPLAPVDPFKLPLQEAQQILNSIGQHALTAPKGPPSTAKSAPIKPW
jgi:hypothetical protein